MKYMTSAKLSYFVDANILVYAALNDDARHEVSKSLLKNGGNRLLHISQQILAEFYSTVTNPKRVTAPYTPAEAIEFIETLLSYEHILLLPISQDVPLRWIEILKTVEVRGAHIFDFQIAAQSQAQPELIILRRRKIDIKSSSLLE